MISPRQVIRLVEMADRVAARLCRRARSSHLALEDIRQELLLDVLARLPKHDPSLGSVEIFVAICLRHRSARMALNLRRDGIANHPVSLDEPFPGQDLVLVDTISEEQGYSAWIGQPTNRLSQLEHRLDLDRALSALPADALPVCATLLMEQSTSVPRTGLSRTTLHRRKHELRCQLLAAGISGPVEQTAQPVGI